MSTIYLTGAEALERALKRMSESDFNKVVRKNLTQMHNRSKQSHNPQAGGTPVYSGGSMGAYNQRSGKTEIYKHTGGQLRGSAGIDVRNGLFYYTAAYAPHVEYGHRQNVGQYVPAIGKRLVRAYIPGQHFLQNNVKIQQPIYIRDLTEALQGALK